MHPACTLRSQAAAGRSGLHPPSYRNHFGCVSAGPSTTQVWPWDCIRALDCVRRSLPGPNAVSYTVGEGNAASPACLIGKHAGAPCDGAWMQPPADAHAQANVQVRGLT